MRQLLALLFLLVVSLASFHIRALTFEYDGFEFEVLGANVVKLIGITQEKSGIVEIPGTIPYNGRSLILRRIENFSSYAYTRNVTNVIIPNTVEEIARRAFYNDNPNPGYDINQIRSITIPSSVRYIGGCAFKGCNALEEVRITDILSWCNINFEPDWYGASSDELGNSDDSWANPLIYAKKLVLNGNVVTQLNIPECITEIHEACFYGLVDATSIKLPNSLEKIDAVAFRSCRNIKEIQIPDNVSFIGQGAFDDCSNLEKVYFGNGIKLIEYGAFYHCSGINQVYISDLKTWCEVIFDKPTRIIRRWDGGVFYPYSICSANPLSYGHRLYLNSEEVTDCEIPVGTKVINRLVFSGCHSIISLKTSNTITSIESGAFDGCVNLEKVYIGSNVERMGYYYDHHRYSYVEGGEVFADCAFLSEVHMRQKNPPQIASNTFSNSQYSYCPLYVPKGSKADYCEFYWYKFKTIIEEESAIDSVKEDGMKVVVRDGCIVVEGADKTPIEVIDMAGRIVFNGYANFLPDLPQGIYIVRIDGQSYKVKI